MLFFLGSQKNRQPFGWRQVSQVGHVKKNSEEAALTDSGPRIGQRHADTEENRAANNDAEDFVADVGHVRLLQFDD